MAMQDPTTNTGTTDVIAPATVPSNVPIKFGFGQIGKATPQIISTIKRALNFFFGGAMFLLPSMAEQFNTTVEKISYLFGFVMLLVNTVGIMFGVEPDTTQQIKPK